jgi:hypothetical protein
MSGGAGCLYFSSRHPAPVDQSAHPTFNAALYTLKVLLPIPDIGDASDWDPHGPALLLTALLHLLGWLLAITVIAAITRAVTRN